MKNLSYTLTALSLVLTLAGVTQGQAATTEQESAVPAGSVSVRSVGGEHSGSEAGTRRQTVQNHMETLNLALEVGRGSIPLSSWPFPDDFTEIRDPISYTYCLREALGEMLSGLRYFVEISQQPNYIRPPLFLVKAAIQSHEKVSEHKSSYQKNSAKRCSQNLKRDSAPQAPSEQGSVARLFNQLGFNGQRVSLLNVQSLAPLIKKLGHDEESLAPLINKLGLDEQSLALLINKLGLDKQRLAPLIEELRREEERLAPLIEELRRKEKRLDQQNEALLRIMVQTGSSISGHLLSQYPEPTSPVDIDFLPETLQMLEKSLQEAGLLLPEAEKAESAGSKQ